MKLSPRSEKLAGIVSEYLPTILQKVVPQEQTGFLTISAIEISGDLMVADVFVRSLNGPGGFVKNLNKYSKKVSFELSQKVKTRLPIKIRFKKDKSIDAIKIFDNPLMKK